MIRKEVIHMSATFQVPAETRKTVALVLTLGIEAWIREQAANRRVSNAVIAREVFEKAMRESEEKGKDAA